MASPCMHMNQNTFDWYALMDVGYNTAIVQRGFIAMGTISLLP